jgi:hypothetical protein
MERSSFLPTWCTKYFRKGILRKVIQILNPCKSPSNYNPIEMLFLFDQPKPLEASSPSSWFLWVASPDPRKLD